MKAWILDGGFGINHLRHGVRPEPSPGPGEVCLRMEAWSLNYRDLLIIHGRYNPHLKLPHIPCSDGVGVVEVAGPGVTHLKVGQRVATCFMPQWIYGPLTRAGIKSALGGEVPGVLSEYAILPARGVIPVPDHLDAIEASTLPCAALTAWNALFESASLRPGQSILTLGTGGVSLFAIQMAKQAGLRVLATTGTPAKAEKLKTLGVDHVLFHHDNPDWGSQAGDLAGGEGVDLVVEVGGAGTLEQSLRAVRPGGIISLIGVLAQNPHGGPNLLPILMKHVNLQGIFVGSRSMFESMNKALSSWQLKPVIDRVFTFDEAPQAVAHLTSGKHIGKVCIKA